MKKILLLLISFTSFIIANEVTVSILPQKYFVEKIAGDKINVNVMVKPGNSPATYEPKTSQMRMLSDSLVYFSIGVPFEKVWLDKFKAANNKMLVVDTAHGIKKIEMEAHEHHDEDEHDEHKEEKYDDHDEHKDHDDHKDEKHDDHDEHEGHDHTGLDPHIWLDPVLVKTQAKNIVEALVKVDPKNKDFYTKKYEAFVKELDALDKKIESIDRKSVV